MTAPRVGPADSSGVATLKTGRAHSHPEPLSGASYSAAELMPGDRTVLMLDQRLLPQQERYEHFTRVDEVALAIRNMTIRGAPAIGVAAAYGMVLAGLAERGDAGAFLAAVGAAGELLGATRPTAKNLSWALDRMKAAAARLAALPADERGTRFADEARALHVGEVAAHLALVGDPGQAAGARQHREQRRLGQGDGARSVVGEDDEVAGELGAAAVPDGARILTYCNAGALATGGYGTALGVIRAAWDAGKKISVIACETRPLFQGARLTAWELAKDGIPVEVITDSMVAQLMGRGGVDLVVVGADRVARSGDVANKVGTYGVACLAHAHGVPFYVAAPMSTVDMDCPDGAAIPIEQRAQTEVTHVPGPAGGQGVAVVPDGVRAQNPSFDVTPARLVRALFTERGIVTPLSESALEALTR